MNNYLLELKSKNIYVIIDDKNENKKNLDGKFLPFFQHLPRKIGTTGRKVWIVN